MTTDTPPPGDARSALRRFRADEARKRNVPAYRVFPNATLESLASLCPRTRDDLSRIPGIGPVTLATYGDALVALLAPHAPSPRAGGPGAPAPIPDWEALPGALRPHLPPGARAEAVEPDLLAIEIPIVERVTLTREEYVRAAEALAWSRGAWIDLRRHGVTRPHAVVKGLAFIPGVRAAGTRVRHETPERT